MQTLKKYPHNIGETVVYRKQGIYEITAIRAQKIGMATNDYYVLSSVYDKNATVYVPVDNDNLTSQIDRMLSKDEIHAIIDNSEKNEILWVENTTERGMYFDEILKSGDLIKVLSLLKMLSLRKESADKKSYRTYARDEKAFANAHKMVTEAFAYPLGISKTEVITYIMERINN